MLAVEPSFGQLEVRLASFFQKGRVLMDRDDLVKWINEAKDPKERSRRKTASFGALYGGPPFSMGIALPHTPKDNMEENTR